MLISQAWITRLLRQTNPQWSVSSEALDAGFVRVGFETEGYAAIPATTGPLVVGRVESIRELEGFKKPIRHCQVNVGNANGTGELQSIVCGARNFAEGDLVVVSLPGAVLPGDFQIAARTTYGETSAGMMCSASELGLSQKQNPGIIVLGPASAEPGDPASEVLGLDDVVFDVNITPDRGYALSARGLAREIASAFELTFEDPAASPEASGCQVDAVPEPEGPSIVVELRPETKATRFGLRKVRGIDPHAVSPWWLQRELMLSGQRPVNVPTDITNYVMLLLGQPMHAFDASKIQGSLVVRNARPGEELETLDGVRRKLHAEDVVIEDAQAVQSLAGVMGGMTSEIADDTTEVVFEAAHWDPLTVARTSRRHKLSSEASRRFERGVDPSLIEVALDLACGLLTRIAGGTTLKERTLVEVEGNAADAPKPIVMSAHKPAQVAGVDYSVETVVRRLEEVGCTVSLSAGESEQLQVLPPTWRPDLTQPVDLVEEVLRLEGLEDIPTTLPSAPPGRGLTPAQRRRRTIGHALAYQGYAEILPTPFVRNDIAEQFGLPEGDARRRAVFVQNPLDAEYSILGTTLLPSMLEALGRNVARGQDSVRLYGLQQVVVQRGEGKSPMLDVSARPSDAEVEGLLASLPEQPLHVATVGIGAAEAPGPWGQERRYSYADALESARIIARSVGVELEVRNGDCAPWHPGRCAELVVGGVVVGHAGELHPQVCERLGLPARVCAMEMNVEALPFANTLPAPVLSSFPALHQDLALVVAEEVAAEAVRAVVVDHAGPLLEGASLFDIYRGSSIGEGQKSLAFALTFRAPDRTLTDEECSQARLAAAEGAKEAFGAQMRA